MWTTNKREVFTWVLQDDALADDAADKDRGARRVGAAPTPSFVPAARMVEDPHLLRRSTDTPDATDPLGALQPEASPSAPGHVRR